MRIFTYPKLEGMVSRVSMPDTLDPRLYSMAWPRSMKQCVTWVSRVQYRWNVFKGIRQAIEDNEGGLDKFSQGELSPLPDDSHHAHMHIIHMLQNKRLPWQPLQADTAACPSFLQQGTQEMLLGVVCLIGEEEWALLAWRMVRASYLRVQGTTSMA